MSVFFLPEFNLLLIIGGDPNYLGRISEMYDLTDLGKTCQKPPDVLDDIDGSIGTILDDQITTCGSWRDDETCYSYSPVTKSWSRNNNYRVYSGYNAFVLMNPDDLWVSRTRESYFYQHGVKTPGPYFPTSLYEGCASKINGTHFIVTQGYNAYVVERATQAITRVDSPIYYRTRHSCTVYQGIFYVFGGTTSTNRHEEFDLSTGRWTLNAVSAPAQAPLRRTRLAIYRGKFLFVGGSTSGVSSYSNQAYEFDPATTTWRKFPLELNLGRNDHQVLLVTEEQFDC